MDAHMTIATTIREQIGARNLMCFGVPYMSALEETGDFLGGLQFNFTNCRKIRSGRVEVWLHNSDTYTVKIYNRVGNLKYECSDIYCENLFEILDYNIGS